MQVSIITPKFMSKVLNDKNLTDKEMNTFVSIPKKGLFSKVKQQNITNINQNLFKQYAEKFTNEFINNYINTLKENQSFNVLEYNQNIISQEIHNELLQYGIIADKNEINSEIKKYQGTTFGNEESQFADVLKHDEKQKEHNMFFNLNNYLNNDNKFIVSNNIQNNDKLDTKKSIDTNKSKNTDKSARSLAMETLHMARTSLSTTENPDETVQSAIQKTTDNISTILQQSYTTYKKTKRHLTNLTAELRQLRQTNTNSNSNKKTTNTTKSFNKLTTLFKQKSKQPSEKNLNNIMHNFATKRAAFLGAQSAILFMNKLTTNTLNTTHSHSPMNNL